LKGNGGSGGRGEEESIAAVILNNFVLSGFTVMFGSGRKRERKG